MNSTKIDPKYISKSNPRIGLIALASDFMIERDFINVIKDREVDLFVNRIECYNPLTKENLIKMSNKVTEVTKDILPDQNIDCVVYGCTSGTIAAGYESIEKKVDSGEARVGFSLFATQIEDVINFADKKLTMPPKSTWFDPKPLDGLVAFDFE